MARASGTWSDGKLHIQLEMDFHAFLIGTEPGELQKHEYEQIANSSDIALNDRIQVIARRLISETVILTPEGSVTPVPENLPDAKSLRAALGTEEFANDIGPVTSIRLIADIPRKPDSLRLQFPRQLGPVGLTWRGSTEPYRELLAAGQTSVNLMFSDSSSTDRSPSFWTTAWRYLLLGYEHILPKGLDHILFVLGLFLLSPRAGPILWQVTAFTLAHSITLALSIYGVLALSPAIVEPLIALSIAAVALENMLTSELKPWRPFVVFAFGLLHGLGFAGVLQDLGLPAGQYVTALVTFNAGVELGQLSVIGLAALVLGLHRNRLWYRGRIVVPASACIGLVGVYWTIERVFS